MVDFQGAADAIAEGYIAEVAEADGHGWVSDSGTVLIVSKGGRYVAITDNRSEVEAFVIGTYDDSGLLDDGDTFVPDEALADNASLAAYAVAHLNNV